MLLAHINQSCRRIFEPHTSAENRRRWACGRRGKVICRMKERRKKRKRRDVAVTQSETDECLVFLFIISEQNRDESSSLEPNKNVLLPAGRRSQFHQQWCCFQVQEHTWERQSLRMMWVLLQRWMFLRQRFWAASALTGSDVPDVTLTHRILSLRTGSPWHTLAVTCVLLCLCVWRSFSVVAVS